LKEALLCNGNSVTEGTEVPGRWGSVGKGTSGVIGREPGLAVVEFHAEQRPEFRRRYLRDRPMGSGQVRHGTGMRTLNVWAVGRYYNGSVDQTIAIHCC
jgi:hypothetical protein